MITIQQLPHTLYPNKIFWYVYRDSQVISIWETFGEAVEVMIKFTDDDWGRAKEDDIFNSLF